MDDRRKVLIIDDEVDLSQLIKGYFNRKNFEVHLAHTLNEGLSAIRSLHPDIVFIDNNFPDGNGWTLVPSLAIDFPRMHITLISAFNSTPPSMPGNDHFHVIEKPIKFTDLDKYLAAIKM